MPNLFAAKKPQLDATETSVVAAAQQYFFTIVLTDQCLQSSLVANNGQGVQIKELSTIKRYFDRKDLLEQLDQSLQELGKESEDVSDTVFAFDQNWLEDGDLTAEKKAVVKELSDELDLHALGQFSVAQALAEARLTANENDSCLLLHFREESFDLIFLKRGQLLDVIKVGRSADVLADVQEALARAAKHLNEEGQYLPEKILLTSLALNQKDLGKLQQALNQYDWAGNPAFLKEPSIAVMESDYMIKSISLAAGKILSKQELRAHLPSTAAVAADFSQPTLTAAQEENTVASKKLEPPPTTARPVSGEEYAVENAATTQASSFGIAFDQKNWADQGKVSQQPVASTPALVPAQKKPPSASPLRHFLLQHRKVLLLGAGGGLLVLLVIFLLFALFFSRVLVTVLPHSLLLQRAADITLDPNLAESDFARLRLKASLEAKESSGEDVLNTTGVSLVGEKAKGKVTIFNKTTQAKDLAQATALTADGGRQYVLEQGVTVPAATEKSSGEGLDYGKAEAAVVASDIGADYNINKDSKFRVADYYDDQFSATAIDNFSGGSSREVRVVAQGDRDKLLSQLSDKLYQLATEELKSANGNGAYYLPTGDKEVRQANYSAEVGAEAESLTLSLTLAVEVIKYQANDLKQLATAVLTSELPEDYVFTSDEPSLLTDHDTASSASASLGLKVELSAKAKAQLDRQSLLQSIAGKSINEAEQILRNDYDVDQVTINYQPAFLRLLFKNLPSNTQRIQLLVED